MLAFEIVRRDCGIHRSLGVMRSWWESVEAENSRSPGGEKTKLQKQNLKNKTATRWTEM
jgi:hypothetical protein